MTNARRLALLPLVALLAVPWVPAAQAQTTGAVSAGDDFKFTPETITVAVGGTVTWTNTGAAPHTVTGGKDGTTDPASPIGDAQLAAGATHVVTFPAAGTFDYYCVPHESLGMVGKVVVGGAAASPTAAVSPTAAASVAPSASASASPAATESHDPAEIPGIKGNAVLDDIKARRASEERTVKGFFTLMGGASIAMVALCIALVASTRRRPS